MLTVFDRIPNLFVVLYDRELAHWAKHFRERGAVQQIVLRSVPGIPVDMNPDRAQGPVRQYVTLRAEFGGNLRTGDMRMIVMPASAEDAEKIARHCREMRGTVLQ